MPNLNDMPVNHLLWADDPTQQSAVNIRERVRKHFIEIWFEALNDQHKLTFYKILKNTFGFEDYLDIKNRSWRKSITRLRSSSHKLQIEVGR